jgi:preprotein translocase subunit SecF
MKAIQFIPEGVEFNFIGKRFAAFVLSLIIILGSIAYTSTKGLNFGIDFTGGTIIEILVSETPDLGELRKKLNELELGSVSIQEFGDEQDLLIRLPQQISLQENAQKIAIEKVKSSLIEMYGEQGVDFRRVEFVGPQVGKELKKAGILAILFSLAGILLYIWFRFEWQFGVAAIIALAHDAIATVGFFSITQMEFNLSTVAAILMIAGYSINDTVVVFDRIRENLRKYKKKPLPDLFNMSINQMLSRTLITSLTTLLALIALWVFGGEVIRGFVDALIFGILIGTYSSIFVAAPLLLFMNVRNKEVEVDGVASEA